MAALHTGLDEKPSQSFTLFPQFPVEIRLGIWERALPAERIINLKHHFHKTQDLGFMSTSTMPLASVCRESRQVVKEKFVLAFGTSTTPARTWFNFERDILYLNWGHIRNLGPTRWTTEYRISNLGPDIKKVQKLAVYMRTLPHGSGPPNAEDSRRYTLSVARILERCGSIKVLSLIHQEADIENEVDLVLTDEGELAALTQIYEKAVYHPKDEKARQALIDKAVMDSMHLQMHIDWDVLQDYRAKDSALQLRPEPLFDFCPMPWKGITNTKLYARFRSARERWEKMKAEYKLPLKLKSKNYKTVTVSAKETTPFTQFVEEYRREAKVPTKLALVSCGTTIHGNSIDPNLTPALYNLLPGASLVLKFGDKQK